MIDYLTKKLHERQDRLMVASSKRMEPQGEVRYVKLVVEVNLLEELIAEAP